jgi:hypothetical protein
MTTDNEQLELVKLAKEALEDDKRVSNDWFATDGCAVFADGHQLIADTYCGHSGHGNGQPMKAPWSQTQCRVHAEVIARSRLREPKLAEEVLRLRASLYMMEQDRDNMVKRAEAYEEQIMRLQAQLPDRDL